VVPKNQKKKEEAETAAGKSEMDINGGSRVWARKDAEPTSF